MSVYQKSLPQSKHDSTLQLLHFVLQCFSTWFFFKLSPQALQVKNTITPATESSTWKHRSIVSTCKQSSAIFVQILYYFVNTIQLGLQAFCVLIVKSREPCIGHINIYNYFDVLWRAFDTKGSPGVWLWFEQCSVFDSAILWMATSRKQVTNRHCVADFSG